MHRRWGRSVTGATIGIGIMFADHAGAIGGGTIGLEDHVGMGCGGEGLTAAAPKLLQTLDGFGGGLGTDGGVLVGVGFCSGHA